MIGDIANQAGAGPAPRRAASARFQEYSQTVQYLQDPRPRPPPHASGWVLVQLVFQSVGSFLLLGGDAWGGAFFSLLGFFAPDVVAYIGYP